MGLQAGLHVSGDDAVFRKILVRARITSTSVEKTRRDLDALSARRKTSTRVWRRHDEVRLGAGLTGLTSTRVVEKT